MITEETKLGVIRFVDGEWLSVRNMGWGIFNVVDGSAAVRQYVGWKYYLKTPEGVVAAEWPNILLYGVRLSGELPKFWYIVRPVVGIESTDATWH